MKVENFNLALFLIHKSSITPLPLNYHVVQRNLKASMMSTLYPEAINHIPPIETYSTGHEKLFRSKINLYIGPSDCPIQ